MKAIEVVYKYRCLLLGCGCCFEDGSYVQIEWDSGLNSDHDCFGPVCSEQELKQRLSDLGVEFADDCDFSKCEYL